MLSSGVRGARVSVLQNKVRWWRRVWKEWAVSVPGTWVTLSLGPCFILCFDGISTLKPSQLCSHGIEQAPLRESQTYTSYLDAESLTNDRHLPQGCWGQTGEPGQGLSRALGWWEAALRFQQATRRLGTTAVTSLQRQQLVFHSEQRAWPRTVSATPHAFWVHLSPPLFCIGTRIVHRLCYLFAFSLVFESLLNTLQALSTPHYSSLLWDSPASSATLSSCLEHPAFTYVACLGTFFL